MAKKEKPDREKALDIFIKNNGNITNRKIAQLLDINEKTVSVWKHRYKWNDKIERSTPKEKRSTTKKMSSREKQQERIIESLKLANSYSPALDVLIEIYLDAYEEYEKAKMDGLDTEPLRKELARLLGQLGLNSNNKNMMQKVAKKEEKQQKQPPGNKLVEFRKSVSR